MAKLTVRGLDQRTCALLGVRAAKRGHSIEEEAQQILKRSDPPS